MGNGHDEYYEIVGGIAAARNIEPLKPARKTSRTSKKKGRRATSRRPSPNREFYLLGSVFWTSVF